MDGTQRPTKSTRDAIVDVALSVATLHVASMQLAAALQQAVAVSRLEADDDRTKADELNAEFQRKMEMFVASSDEVYRRLTLVLEELGNNGGS